MASLVLFLVRVVNFIFQLLFILVLADVILSYFMSPFHPVRMFISRIVSPMLNPIRRVLPTMGGFDFSPIVLIILLQVLNRIITSLLLQFAGL